MSRPTMFRQDGMSNYEEINPQTIGALVADVRNMSERLRKAEDNIDNIDNRVTQIFVEVRETVGRIKHLDDSVNNAMTEIKKNMSDAVVDIKSVMPAVESVKQ